MTTMNCKSCGEDKPTAEMFVRGGKPIRTCNACKAKQMSGNGGANKKPATVKAKDAKPAAISAPVPGARFTLVIEQGYGLTAAIDEEYLIVTQHDGETGDDDKICLSRSELRQLIEKFGDWTAC